jgi:DNA-binding CsgD family transcriptional regulator/type II secretory pathway predicted ATPase ExeA
MNWPIAPRDPLRARIETALRRRPFPSVLVTGPTGIGKTTLSRNVVAQIAADGGTVVEIVALAELTDVPLGALAPALSSQALRGTSDLGERLANAVGAIVASDPAVVFVDDAPLLDELSAAAIYQLVRVYKIPCLLTGRDEHPLTGAIQRLDHESLIERIDVGPLGAHEVEALLEHMLGNVVEPESVRSLLERSQGNPLVLRTLALAAEEQDTIRTGVHGLVVDEPTLPQHVSAIMSSRIADLPAAVRSRAVLLALAQPLPRRVLADNTAMDAVVRAGLATTVGAAGDERLTVQHPLLTQVLIDECPPHEREQIALEASNLLLSSGDQQLRFRGVLLRLRYGLDTPAEQLVWAAGYAHVVQDHALAVRLATLGCAHEPNFDGQLTLGSALSALGDAGTASALHLAIELATTDEERSLAVARLGHHLAIREGRATDAVDLAVGHLATLNDPTARALLGAELMKWQSMAGTALPATAFPHTALPHTATSSTGGTPADTELTADDGPGALAALIGEAMLTSMLGFTARTAEVSAAARPLAEKYVLAFPFGGELLDLNDFLVLVFDGQLLEAEEFARSRYERPRSDSSGLWSYTLALVAIHTGRASEAQSLANQAVNELAWRDFTGLQGPAIAVRATASAQLGIPTTVDAEITDAHRTDIKVVLQLAEARAWLLAHSGDMDAAAATILDAAQAGVAANHLALAALTASTAVRFGRGVVVAPLLSALSETTGAPLIGALAAAASAQASGTTDDLAAAAEQLSTAGLAAGAIDLWELAARASPGGERARSLRRTAERRGHGQNFFSFLRPESTSNELTERELLIARAAAARKRSHEIAEELGLSVRTIDNHLGRIYRKLGVSNRLQLDEALREISE